LRIYERNDSPPNAIAIPDMLTVSIQSALKRDLDKFEPCFSAFSEDFVSLQLKQQLSGGAST
jgi:hypothetical protein